MEFEQKSNDHVVCLFEKQHGKDPLPEVGKTYIAYNDGKINFNRLEFITVTKIVDLDKDAIPPKDMEWIEEEINDCPWLYDSHQQQIFYATTNHTDSSPTIFLMTYGGCWFSLGWLVASQLDIDGSLTKSLFASYKEQGTLDDIKSDPYFIAHQDILNQYL